MKELVKEFKFRNIVIILVLASVSLAEIASSFTLSRAVNSIVQPDLTKFVQSILLTLLIFFIYLAFTYFKIVYQGQTEEKMKVSLREGLVDRLVKTDYQTFHQKKPASYSSWLMNDVRQVATDSISPFYDLLAGVISLVLSLLTLLTLHWLLIAYTLLSLALILLLPRLFKSTIVQETIKLSQGHESYLSKVTDFLAAYDTLFSYRQLPFMKDQLANQAKDLSDKSFHYTKVMAWVAVAGGLGNVLGQVGIIALTGYLALTGQVTVGSIMVTTSLAGNIFNSSGNLSQMISRIQSSQPIFEKFQRVQASPKSKEQTLTTQPLTGGYSLENVHFAYADKQVIDNFTMDFHLAKNYAIVGESGSGKSTLLNLIGGRLDHYQGSIRLAGKELNQSTYQELFDQVLYIDQNPHIFDGTIRENLEMGQTYSDEDLYQALDQVHLADLIAGHSDGLDYYIGEGGKMLSGGQKQRLSIARSLLRDKKILLLDEVTSSLDQETAISIEKLLLSDEETSVIMITHNLRDQVAGLIDHTLVLS